MLFRSLTRAAAPNATMFDGTGHVVTEPFPGVVDDHIDVAFRRDDELATMCILLRPPPLTVADLCP